ncbi:MAG: DinB family protein [Acidobacteriota bacterium]
MRYSMLILAAACSASLYAQDAAASVAAIQRQYAQTKSKILAGADEMPESGYTLVPGEGSRTFAAVVGPIADAQASSCGAVNGTPVQLNAERGMTSKADLVAALKKSFDLCDIAYASINAANHDEAKAAAFGGPQPLNTVLWGNLAHSEEMYGAMGVYLRVQKLVPPSSQGRGGAGKGGKGGPPKGKLI